MENTKAELRVITADGNPNVEQADLKVREDAKFEEEKATVSTKWKWVWRDICYVAEEVLEGQDESVEEVRIEAEEGNTAVLKVVPTTSGVKRKVGIDGGETDETAEKKEKLSENLDVAMQKMEM